MRVTSRAGYQSIPVLAYTRPAVQLLARGQVLHGAGGVRIMLPGAHARRRGPGQDHAQVGLAGEARKEGGALTRVLSASRCNLA